MHRPQGQGALQRSEGTLDFQKLFVTQGNVLGR